MPFGKKAVFGTKNGTGKYVSIQVKIAFWQKSCFWLRKEFRNEICDSVKIAFWQKSCFWLKYRKAGLSHVESKLPFGKKAVFGDPAGSISPSSGLSQNCLLAKKLFLAMKEPTYTIQVILSKLPFGKKAVFGPKERNEQ